MQTDTVKGGGRSCSLGGSWHESRWRCDECLLAFRTEMEGTDGDPGRQTMERTMVREISAAATCETSDRNYEAPKDKTTMIHLLNTPTKDLGLSQAF